MSDESKPGSQVRVLAVDDDHDTADVLAIVLKKLGADARAAYDGRSAIEIAGTFQPHLILLDLAMPLLEGFAALAELRRVEGNPGAVIYALTGRVDQASRAKALDAGFDGFLAKPCDIGALREALASASPK